MITQKIVVQNEGSVWCGKEGSVWTEIPFKANFDAENPRLDVFVRNKNNEEALIPNLYFSTAQINILSLSIFLASALNSKEYQCIFIDDPIQSMDSINVLSTIDLLRSIVLNKKKQIILSTHDENFHKLLKKKMPPNLFKSKFLELEGFGKVKSQ
jgi:exonuclease SbcC